MLTVNKRPVSVVAVDRREQLATVRFGDGRIRVVPLHQLCGKRADVMHAVAMAEREERRSAR